MRKLFLLIPALVLSLVLNAAVINITPTSPYGENDNLRKAVYYATAGDEIILADGTYFEPSSGGYLELNKDITIKAAEGAHPIIQMEAYARISNGANVSIEGLKFDGSVQGSYEYYFRFYDNSNTSLVLEGCEFYDIKNIVITGKAATHTNSLIVNDCYFHNNAKQSIYFEASTTEGIQTCDRLEIRNSTIANTTALTNWISIIDIRPYGTTVTDAIKVIIDHCTFYNNPCVDSGHANIRTHYLSDVSISNSVFAHPTELAQRAVYCDTGGTVKNCLTFNFTKDTERYGISYGCTIENCALANPLFADAANGDFSLAGDWVTMNISPARGAATDGSDLGDPRWYSAETLPETNFAEPYDLIGTKALLSGNIELNANNHIVYKGSSEPGIATWKMHIEKAYALSGVIDMEEGNTSGCTLKLIAFDADGNKVDSLVAPYTDKDLDVTIPGCMYIPAEGDYTFKLYNGTGWSSSKIEKITLSYMGGEVQAMPGTTDIEEAWFVGGTRADGKISFPSSTIQNGWVKWNVSFANTGNYNVTLNVNSNNCKNYTVALVDANDDDVVTPLTLNDCSTKGTPVALAMGAMEVPAGNYILKVTNSTQNSDAELISVNFAYTGGGIIDIPGAIALNEAILSERAFIDGDGLHFVDADHLWLMSEGYAKWNIHVAADGMYKFTANCNTDGESYSNLTIKVLKGGEEKYSYTPPYTYTGEKTINSPEWFLEAGDYELKLSNPANNSNGYLVSLSAAAVEGILIVDEMATDMQNIIDLNGKSRKPLLKRSFKGGMYNTVLFPFNGVTDEELITIFGAGYELLEMISATLDGNTLNLNFASVDLSQHTYGRPYLIKPTQDVVNPLFNSHTIYKSTSHLTAEGSAADFIGSFIKGEVPAGEDNLFLGPDNLLYFSQTATPIKGMRAYFRVKGVANPAQAIKRARIVTGGQVATEINLVNESAKIGKSAKIIENGQLVIIRDGIRYNVMGAMIK